VLFGGKNLLDISFSEGYFKASGTPANEPRAADIGEIAFIFHHHYTLVRRNLTMTNALRQKVKVQPGGVILIRSPELTPGATAEVIVLMETLEGEPARAVRVRELAELFKTTQALPQAQAISEDEIASEIAAYRASRS